MFKKIIKSSFLILTIGILFILSGCSGFGKTDSEDKKGVFYSLKEEAPEGFEYCVSIASADGNIVMYAREETKEYVLYLYPFDSKEIKELYRDTFISDSEEYFVICSSFSTISSSPLIIKDGFNQVFYAFDEDFSGVNKFDVSNLNFYNEKYSGKNNTLYFIDDLTYYLSSYSFKDDNANEVFIDNMNYGYLYLESLLEENSIAVLSTSRVFDGENINLLVDSEKGEVIGELPSDILFLEVQGDIYALREAEDKILIALYNKDTSTFSDYMEVHKDDNYYEYYVDKPSGYLFMYASKDPTTIAFKCCDLAEKKLLYENEYTFTIDDSKEKDSSDEYSEDEFIPWINIVGTNKVKSKETSLVFSISLAGNFEDIVVWNLSEEEGKDESLVSQADWSDYKDISVENPSDYGELSDYAESLSERFGVNISIGQKAVIKFYDFSVTALEDETITYKALRILENTLSLYPDNFFSQFKDTLPRGISIHITGTISTIGEGIIENAAGFAVPQEGIQYIVLDGNYIDNIRRNITHEISHAIDNRLLSLNGILDERYFDEEVWNKFNPEGFNYYNSYLDENGQSYEFTGSGEYTYTDGDYWKEGDVSTIYFIDPYAKTFPTEDRARIMEYSMLGEGTPEYMQGEHMQGKLRYYYAAIRKAWDTTGWPEVTCWEEVLQP